ncbi:MAG: TraR/DksA family transcriptional regulator [Pseudomonadota bacterium]
MDTVHFTRVLTDRKAYLEHSLDHIERELDKEPPKDFEDRATEREGDEVMEHLGTAELAELRAVNAALHRIEAGTYGDCAACGEEISSARLEVVPHTQKCRNCA